MSPTQPTKTALSRTRSPVVFVLLFAFLCLACERRVSDAKTPVDLFIATGTRLPAGYTLFKTSNSFMNGLSGLTIDPASTLWAVPETERILIPLEQRGAKLRLRQKPIEIVGVDRTLDIESIAAVSNTEFIVGTEGSGSRAKDKLFRLKLQNGRARVVKAISVDYGLWETEGAHNQGVEGLCYANKHLVVAAETVFVDKGKRYAPIALYPIAANKWYPVRLSLTTQSGKISALYCRMTEDDTLSVLAVERHYGIARVLSFTLPTKPPPAAADPPVTLSPRVERDLAGLIDPLPNFEGIAQRDKDLFLVTDNDHSGIIGPAFLLKFSSISR